MTKSLIALLFAGCAFAQSPAAVNLLLDKQLRGVEQEIVPLIEAMPADKINFAPTAGAFTGVRTFAEQAKHVAAVIYMVSAAANVEKVPVDLGGGENGPSSVKSKEEVVQFVKDAFAYAHKAMATLTADNLTKPVKSPFGEGQMTKGGAMFMAISHTFDHYGQMVVYARMNNIVPPASR